MTEEVCISLASISMLSDVSIFYYTKKMGDLAGYHVVVAEYRRNFVNWVQEDIFHGVTTLCDDHKEFFRALDDLRKLFYEQIQTTKIERIGLPEDGKHKHFKTPEECLSYLDELKEWGYRIDPLKDPRRILQHVIDVSRKD